MAERESSARSTGAVQVGCEGRPPLASGRELVWRQSLGLPGAERLEWRRGVALAGTEHGAVGAVRHRAKKTSLRSRVAVTPWWITGPPIGRERERSHHLCQ